MSIVKHHKVVSALPAELEANSIYYVRSGLGFDQYVTNSSGAIAAYPLNQPNATPLSVPAYRSSGSQLLLALTSNQSLPVINASGTTLNISVITNG